MTSRDNYGIPDAPKGTRWASVKEASAVLGISIRSVRRAIAEGRLDVHRPNQRNKPLSVAVPLEVLQRASDPAASPASPTDSVAAPTGDVVALKVENAELKTRLSLVSEQMDGLRDELRATADARDKLQGELMELARQSQRGPIERLVRAWRGT